MYRAFFGKMSFTSSKLTIVRDDAEIGGGAARFPVTA